MSRLRYNFVFFFARYDFWKSILGEELYNNKHVRVYKEAFQGSGLLQKLFHYHWAYSINKKICLPFKSAWFKKMYKQDFEDNLPIVFVYLAGGTIYYGKEFLKYVKQKNPNNKNVMLYEDLIAKGDEKEHCLLKNLVDLEVTYDDAEAQKYGIEFFWEMVYSKIIPSPEKDNFEYDIYYLGVAKDRLPKIMEAYEYFSSNGLKCKFIIPGVPQDQRIECEEISYEYISYEENIRNVIKSKCLLEIVQGGSSNTTLRCKEAIAYRRRFITDCSADLSECFHTGQYFNFSKATIHSVPIDKLKMEIGSEEYTPLIDLNPLKRLYFLQEKLDSQRN